MPTKKGRSTNKKKKKNQFMNSNQHESLETQAPSSISHHSSIREYTLEDQDFPTWQDFPVNSDCSTPLQNSYSSVYDRYKQATKRFKESLFVEAGFSKDKTKILVDDLMDAADLVAGQQREVDPLLIQDLKLALRVRKRVAESVFQGGDAGHAYFQSVLNYCYRVLRPLKRKRKEAAGISREKTNDSFENRFTALNMEFEDDEDDDENEELPDASVARPHKEASLEIPNLEDIIQRSERLDAVFFLTTLNDMMGFVSLQYSKLKSFWRKCHEMGYPLNIIIEQLMEASVATNMSISQVAYLEHRIAQDHPHMNTIYRLLAAVVLPEFTRHLFEFISENSPKAKDFQETDAIAFLGDCLECAFRTPSDPLSHSEPLVSKFSTKWKVDQAGVEKINQMVAMSARIEAPFNQENGMNKELFQHTKSLGLFPHTWLRESEFIGRNRSILVPIRLLQGFSAIKPEQNKLILKQGFFGKKWDEYSRKAKKIQGDMDEFLMGDVMPLLINMCDEGTMSKILPMESELLPFFVHMRSFVKNPERPVTWALVFAVHSLLTSVIEVQGMSDVKTLGNVAKQTFDHYMDQIKWTIQNSEDMDANPKHWMKNLKMIHFLQWLPVSPLSVHSPDKVERGVWNPLCAGTLLTYITYFANIDGGMAMVDAFAQLRIVLHLFNAFIQVGALEHGELELLDFLYENFITSKAIWEGDIPKKGSFTYRWWIAYGMKFSCARESSQATKRRVENLRTPHAKANENVGFNMARTMTPIQPQDLYKSYSRICLRDFTGTVDKYHSERQKRDGKGTDLYELAVRVNDTLDHMEADERALATNFISLGYILNQFVVSLFRVLELESFVKQIVAEMSNEVRHGRAADFRRIGSSSWEASDANLERQAIVQIFADKILGVLDFTDNPYEDKLVVRSAAFMKLYFPKINIERVMIFTPTREED